eukprot:SAG31_NODE_45694_length_257_cov_12.056962_1_plen_24_part_01
MKQTKMKEMAMEELTSDVPRGLQL